VSTRSNNHQTFKNINLSSNIFIIHILLFKYIRNIKRRIKCKTTAGIRHDYISITIQINDIINFAITVFTATIFLTIFDNFVIQVGVLFKIYFKLPMD